jgi:hypothetical protein
MTTPKPIDPATTRPMRQVPLNDTLPSSSPRAASPLMGLGIVVAVIVLALMYGNFVGF